MCHRKSIASLHLPSYKFKYSEFEVVNLSAELYGGRVELHANEERALRQFL